MLRFYQARKKLDGFMFRHFTYEELRAVVKEDEFVYFPHFSFSGHLKKKLRSLGFYYAGRYVIAISDAIKNPNSIWYLLGHELGHYYLHKEEEGRFRIDVRKKECVEEKVEFTNIIEAQANIFSKLTFIPLEYVRNACEGHDLLSMNMTVKENLVKYALDRFKDPKPNRKSLEKKIVRLFDSYRILLACQNVLEINAAEMETVLNTKAAPNVFKCAKRLFQ